MKFVSTSLRAFGELSYSWSSPDLLLGICGHSLQATELHCYARLHAAWCKADGFSSVLSQRSSFSFRSICLCSSRRQPSCSGQEAEIVVVVRENIFVLNSLRLPELPKQARAFWVIGKPA